MREANSVFTAGAPLARQINDQRRTRIELARRVARLRAIFHSRAALVYSLRAANFFFQGYKR